MPGLAEDYIDIRSDYVPNYLPPPHNCIGPSRGFVNIESLELDESKNEYTNFKLPISSDETVKL